ncbi:MAG: ribonuclease J [Deltaproteobacteria bacterium]|nr:ribonuclease J [Deltaproteobacteria bacterium]
MSESRVTLTPLGGLGEIGMNCLALETEHSMILVDCGLMFPDVILYGVDVVIPRMDFILERKHKLKGIILTHGHEDHIGALAWLVPGLQQAPLFGSEFTLRLALKRIQEHGLDDHVVVHPVKGGDRVQLGDFAVTFIPVCHSIIEGFGLGIETPVGRIVHSGDFKIDRHPLNGHATDLDAFAKFSGDGALLLLSDSTNVEREGFSLTEREIMASLDDVFAAAKGRILVTLFATHIQRMQEIFDLAAKHGRKVAFTGRSLITNIDVAKDLGHLRFNRDNSCDMEDLAYLDDSQIVIILTGSQGEPLSALSRVARGEHRQINIHHGDTVIMSSRFIPGNTKAITKVINDLYRLGANVLYERVQAIHASGHAHQEELKILLDTVRPKFFIPIHGEYRHLFKHAELAVTRGIASERAIILENGQPVTLLPSGLRLEEAVYAESILVDGKGVGDVGQSVLKERQILGGEGLVIVLLVQDEYGTIVLGPSIQSKGFIFEQHYAHVLEDAKCIILDIIEGNPGGEAYKLEERIRSSLRRFFRKVLERDPIVMPLVVRV